MTHLKRKFLISAQSDHSFFKYNSFRQTGITLLISKKHFFYSGNLVTSIYCEISVTKYGVAAMYKMHVAASKNARSCNVVVDI